jgi:hypothetical protein
MKSIQTSMIATSLALGLLTLAPARIHAQPVKVLIALTVTYQDPNPKQPPASNPNIAPSDTKTAKLTSANILRLLAGSAGPFPSGSYLTYDSITGAIGAMDTGNSNDFEDLSSYISVTPDASGNGPLTSSSNEDQSDPIAWSIVQTADAVITFDDGSGNSFTISGVVKSTDSLAKLTTAQSNAGDAQTETVSFSGSVSGWGTYLGNKAVFTGTVSGSGKGPAGS